MPNFLQQIMQMFQSQGGMGSGTSGQNGAFGQGGVMGGGMQSFMQMLEQMLGQGKAGTGVANSGMGGGTNLAIHGTPTSAAYVPPSPRTTGPGVNTGAATVANPTGGTPAGFNQIFRSFGAF